MSGLRFARHWIIPLFALTGIARCSAAEWSAAGRLDLTTNYRYSDDRVVPLPLSPGGPLRAVDPGSSFEISRLRLSGSLHYGDRLEVGARLDIFDHFDRNSTSADKDVDVDEFWLRFGRELAAWEPPEDGGVYLKLGKFAKFERQSDPHLDSYGLVSTAFNRFEDLGLEAGLELACGFYRKASVTSGNPVFMRDSNALAGDNGVAVILNGGQARFHSGLPIFYDAEVEDLVWDTNYAESGLAAGWRAELAPALRLNVMVFGYRRKLKDEAHLFGTLYGGDLDLFSGPGSILTDVDGDRKREAGINLWLYWGDVSLFLQHVEQETAGLGRRGTEAELAWQIELPPTLVVGEYPLFTSLQPAARWSRLDPEFSGPDTYPAASAWWDWQKIDLGCDLTVCEGVRLSSAYSWNEFSGSSGSGDLNELLLTLNLQRAF